MQSEIETLKALPASRFVKYKVQFSYRFRALPLPPDINKHVDEVTPVRTAEEALVLLEALT